MSLVDADTGEVVSNEDYLDALASRIRIEQQRGRDGLTEAYEAALAIGHCLREAREALPSNQAFGAWFRRQEFGFSQKWAHTLRTGAEHESAVRTALRSQLLNGAKFPNLEKAIKQAVAANGAGRSERPALTVVRNDEPEVETPSEFTTLVIDPPWRYDNVATRGAAEDHYPTMSQADLLALDLPAANDAHLYLWVTNSFFEDGFELMRSWGFAYKTCLTWCKPSIGMGNYFRNNTEHVLFGVRGKLPTNRNDVGTWFEAPKTKHSAKPESFYDLVESCSPGPYLEMFARRRRFGWHVWGNEA